MISKVFGVALLVACSQAIHNDHHNAPTSFASFNDNHNTVQHIQSAPRQHYASKPHSASFNAPAPSHSDYRTPSVSSHQASSYSSTSFAPSNSHGAPAPQRYTHIAPISHQAYAAPQHTAPTHSYNQASFSQSPTVHQFAPASHQVAPAAYKVAPVAYKVAPAAYKVAPVAYKVAPVAYKVAPVAHQVPTYAHQSAPIVKVAPSSYVHAAPAHHEEEYAPAHYEFSYGVEDHHTGDIHSHQESRKGDHTEGQYSLHEADGTIRTVKYTVDGHSGFNAVVERSGHPQVQAHQPIKALVAAPHQQYHH